MSQRRGICDLGGDVRCLRSVGGWSVGSCDLGCAGFWSIGGCDLGGDFRCLCRGNLGLCAHFGFRVAIISEFVAARLLAPIPSVDVLKRDTITDVVVAFPAVRGVEKLGVLLSYSSSKSR